MIGWWRRRSLRARLVLIGTFGLAAGFLVFGRLKKNFADYL